MIETIDLFINADNFADKSVTTIILFILLSIVYKLIDEKIIKKE